MHAQYMNMQYVYLLDIPRQLTCMKLGTRELYQPIQSCHVVCLGISNKSVAVLTVGTYTHVYEVEHYIRVPLT